MNTTAKNTKNTTATKTTKNVSKKEGTAMTKKNTKTEKNVKPAETKSAETKAPEISKKDLFATAVDAWLEHYKKDCEGNGSSVIIKTWEKIPTCRALRVDNVTYFEIYYSSRGVRLCAKSKLIPEDIRPEGATIIQNGLDLCIPTFTDIAENLTKYADACRKSIADAKAAKEKAKAAKEAERKAKAAETKAAAK